MAELGLRCGIEIHQQLEGKKLFCSCPTLLRDDEPNFTIKRKLRAVAGEGGEIDIAAKQEQVKDQSFIYQGYNDTTCLVETDCEPPHKLNSEALYTSLQLSKALKAKISKAIQVMRKTVVDGSNTSGFQRTALVARNGEIETSEGIVRIENTSLEEDACRLIAENSEEKVYRLDRLGIPLIEIGTAPDIKSPEQCLETAKKLGMLLRSLPGIKRGLGTIRQDINISIAGGSRIEIKGAQDLHLLPTYVELEAMRQQRLLMIMKGRLKNLAKDHLKKHPQDTLNNYLITESYGGRCLTNIFKNTKCKFFKESLENKKLDYNIIGFRLPSFKGILGSEIQPGRRIGTELSDFVKVKTGIKGIIHSDEELTKYQFTESEISQTKKELKVQSEDAFIIILVKGLGDGVTEAIFERLIQLDNGIPKEVRKANPDGTSSFMRPMPGSARMYPETDVPLIKPELKNIKLPELMEEKINRFVSLGLGRDLAEFIAKSEKVFLFEELNKKYPKIKPAFIAETLTSTLIELRRNYQADTDKLTEENFKDLFKYLDEEKIHKDIVLDVLIEMAKGKFDIKNYESLSTEEIHKVLKEIVEKNKNAPFGALMGLAVKKLQGKASGQFISQELKKLVK